jgi:cytoskeletal protein RodZ
MSQEFPSDMIQPTVEPTLKPGYRLRSAREAKLLSQEQVAAQLCLRPFQIEAIERDDYSYVPAPVYARGHIAMYARLLGLPLEELMQSFAQLQPEQPIPRLQTNVHFTSEDLGEERWVLNKKVRWLGLGVLVIALLMALIWWAGHTEEKHQARNTIAVSPGDAGDISQVNGNSITVPATLAPEASKSNVSKDNNATNKDQKEKKAHNSAS